ncbi:condensation domain-containing protein [Gordonia sp. SL306]|uniref:condensation domain-containing protein n=1 Tax=Gordonia sp. SL306 TaxID=2995145 RepID=UPI002270C42E|nr:condensation domain-containing protein [Gordonia sp. SL306]WAC54650.1 condensation domain-containing protein [Gordonia sp. SL306]
MMTAHLTSTHGVTGAQAGIWYGQELIGTSSTYVVAQAWECLAPVELSALASSVAGAIGEAPGLSASFGMVGGEVVQSVGRHEVDTVAVLDFSGHDDPRAAAWDWMRRRSREPVDPATDPCFEAVVLRLAAGTGGQSPAIVFVRAHHIVTDFFGLGLLGRRAAELYAATTSDTEPRPAWFGPVEDVLDHENHYRDSGDREGDRTFWAGEVLAADAVASLVRHAGRERTSSVLSHTRTIGGTAADHLTELGREQGGSWSDAVTGLVAAFIAGRTGTDEVVLGYPMMNRLGSPAISVPTMVVNVVPLRLTVSAWSSVTDVTEAAVHGVRRVRPHARFRGEDIARLGGHGRPRIWLNVKAVDDRLRLGDVDTEVHSLARGPVEEMTITIRRTLCGEIEFQFDGDESVLDATGLAVLGADIVAYVEEAAQPAARGWRWPGWAAPAPRRRPDRPVPCPVRRLWSTNSAGRLPGSPVASR